MLQSIGWPVSHIANRTAATRPVRGHAVQDVHKKGMHRTGEAAAATDAEAGDIESKLALLMRAFARLELPYTLLTSYLFSLG